MQNYIGTMGERRPWLGQTDGQKSDCHPNPATGKMRICGHADLRIEQRVKCGR